MSDAQGPGGPDLEPEDGGELDESHVFGDRPTGRVWLTVTNSYLGRLDYRGPVNLVPLITAFAGIVIGGTVWLASAPAGITMITLFVMVSIAWYIANWLINRT